MESRNLEVNGIRMRWEEQGEGPPVVFVHGIPTSPRLWRHVIPQVREARSMAWDMVGYGASIEEGRERDISVAKQADYLAAWMRTVGLEEQALVVGHDLGGVVAQIRGSRRWYYVWQAAGTVTRLSVLTSSTRPHSTSTSAATDALTVSSAYESIPETWNQRIRPRRDGQS